MTLTFTVSDRLLTRTDTQRVIADSVNSVSAQIVFDDEWAGMTKTVYFSCGCFRRAVTPVESGVSFTVPWEVLRPGNLFLSVEGYLEGTRIVTAKARPIRVLPSGRINGASPAGEVSGDVYEQLLDQMAAVRTIAQSVRDDADDGAFRGAKGDKGDQGDPGASVVFPGGMLKGNGTGGVTSAVSGTDYEKPKGTYELIEKVIAGYSVLTEQPSDWTANYASYYKNSGTAKEPVYTAVSNVCTVGYEEAVNAAGGSYTIASVYDIQSAPLLYLYFNDAMTSYVCVRYDTHPGITGALTAGMAVTVDTAAQAVTYNTVPAWEAGTYFVYNASFEGNITRTADTDGTAYSFSRVMERYKRNTAGKLISSYAYSGSTRCGYIWVSNQPSLTYVINFFPDCGVWRSAMTSEKSAVGGAATAVDGRITLAEAPTVSKLLCNACAGDVIEIYGVKA